MSTIAFTCPKCLRRDNLTREKTDPVKAFSATLVCPDCDDGDFHSPEFFDADGRHIDEGTGEAYAAAQALASGGAESPPRSCRSPGRNTNKINLLGVGISHGGEDHDQAHRRRADRYR
ncbi:hypothetical protein [Caulobacter sp. UC70_42]|uniref:hypothetical protein n=1 Tax=Caulobacter sp. UC70_42 TaxID=3374551 RepID=UPI00375843F5